MDNTGRVFFSGNRNKWFRAALFCTAGLLINILFARLAIHLGLPLYLDSVGVILCSVLGGYIPGILVGYLTNLINGIFDPATAYYGTLSVFIAVLATYLYRRGWFRKIHTLLLSILAFAVAGGCLGSILTWMLYGFDFGTGISSRLAHYFYENLLANVFWAQFTADFLIDIVDKAVSVGIVLIILALIPEQLKERVDFRFWRQAPLTREELRAVEKEGPAVRTRSIRSKVISLLCLAMLVIGIVTTGISFALFHDATIDAQCTMGRGLLNVAKEYIDADRVDEFIEKGEDAPGYLTTEEYLSNLRKSSEDIEYVYVYRILPDGCHVVFDPDTEDLPGEDPGAVIPFDEAFRDDLPDLLAGKEISPVISNETYGWLLTIYSPLYDSEGKCTCYVAVDISMNDLLLNELSFLARVVSLFLGFFVLIIAAVLSVTNMSLILPLNTMTLAAEKFAFNSEVNREESLAYFRKAGISTGDEIENLYHAFAQTSADMLQYMTDMQEKNETITHMQNSLIEVMADLVESRDQYTGNHVRNTALYAEIILKQMKKEGIYADQLTDEFIEDVIHSAPLHDVGKIKISDTLLNKPGKLTDEEFKRMKLHTVAGREIIADAADALSERGYLDEAENLAAYHHEKWNGTGYPYGLKGEEIPLSARVMAVADVFDALVSRRSYKEGFPVDKALDIIREGSGTHFDPNVAGAFLDAEEEVRNILKKSSGKSDDPVT